MFPFGPPPNQGPPQQPPRPGLFSNRPPFQQPFQQQPPQQKNTTSNLMSMFQTPDGNFDMNKITNTVQQVGKLYGQVSPMLKFFK
ncbi:MULTISPECIES: YppG family protein [unclassified Virgibacillus]|uniref:YppG family protein n=1 Tax=unclassified Virgibacillus TaxID=2620237 RepID=UPI0024DEC209|nr:YppG family protein [Virgibacillus sp. LDC-1]